MYYFFDDFFTSFKFLTNTNDYKLLYMSYFAVHMNKLLHIICMNNYFKIKTYTHNLDFAKCNVFFLLLIFFQTKAPRLL